MTLDEIALKYGTDKATSHPLVKPPHGYTLHYEVWFKWVREEKIKVLEIGVGGAHSIKTWVEYFPNAQIFGVDKVSNTNPWNTPKSNIHPRYTFVHGDQSDETFWRCFVADYGKDWDILIDDGGHFANQILTTWKMMWPHIKSGGLYCIEDLASAYGTLFVPPGWQNHMEFVKNRLDKINHSEDGIKFLYFSKELAIFCKA